MQKIVIALLLSTTIIFGGLYISQSIGKTNNTTNLEVDPNATNKLQAENKSLQTKIKSLEAENEKLKSQIKTLELARTELAKVTKAETTAKVGDKKLEVVEVDNNTSPFVKMLQDPTIMEAMKQRRDQMVLSRYSYLLNKLNLDETKKAKLIELLGERSSAAMAYGMKANMSESQEIKDQATKERDQLYAEADAKIADLLGSDYGTYTDYNEKENEYRTVENLNERLEKNPLDDKQKDQLATVMNQTNSTFKFTNEKVSQDRWAVYRLSEEERTAHVKEMEVRDEMVLKDSSQFLTSSQIEELKKEQSQTRERILRGGGRGRFGRGGGDR